MTTPTPTPKPNIRKKAHITIRQATLYDHIYIGQIASDTYYPTPLTRFLSPHLDEYYSHYVRGFTERALKRMLDPRNLTFVAVDEALGVPIGHLQSERLGDDEGAKRQIRSRRSWVLWILNWVYTAWCILVSFVVGGDKASDPEALRLFLSWGEEQDEKYWKPFEERRERWHVQSCVVRPEYQGQGIGKRMMKEVLMRAQEEGVVVGLEASEEGEWMYTSAGFRLLGRFEQEPYEETLGSGGGVMMWTPEGWKGETGGD